MPGVVTSLEVLYDSRSFRRELRSPCSLSGTVGKGAHSSIFGISQKSLEGKSVN